MLDKNFIKEKEKRAGLPHHSDAFAIYWRLLELARTEGQAIDSNLEIELFERAVIIADSQIARRSRKPNACAPI
tara:strand:- start:25 stop:246 length:222 start_codon:yes stop_codon:yes gene_type:complete